MDPNELDSVKYVYIQHGRNRIVQLSTILKESIVVCEPAKMPAELALARLMNEYGNGPVLQYSIDHSHTSPRPRNECDPDASAKPKWVAVYSLRREVKPVTNSSVIYVVWYGNDEIGNEDIYKAYKNPGGFDLNKKIVV